MILDRFSMFRYRLFRYRLYRHPANRSKTIPSVRSGNNGGLGNLVNGSRANLAGCKYRSLRVLRAASVFGDELVSRTRRLPNRRNTRKEEDHGWARINTDADGVSFLSVSSVLSVVSYFVVDLDSGPLLNKPYLANDLFFAAEKLLARRADSKRLYYG
jgi:hypothetical protein